MIKTFLFLYPIKEYIDLFSRYKVDSLEKLNFVIDKRYRQKEYKIVFAIYKDKEIYGINLQENDQIIYTNISYDGTYIYPDEKYLLSQLSPTEELIIGGFHYSDCVKKVAEKAFDFGINCQVDLELTDLFFNVYNREYFNPYEYNKELCKKIIISRCPYHDDEELSNKWFNKNYSSYVYGFKEETSKRIK